MVFPPRVTAFIHRYRGLPVTHLTRHHISIAAHKMRRRRSANDATSREEARLFWYSLNNTHIYLSIPPYANYLEVAENAAAHKSTASEGRHNVVDLIPHTPAHLYIRYVHFMLLLQGCVPADETASNYPASKRSGERRVASLTCHDCTTLTCSM